MRTFDKQSSILNNTLLEYSVLNCLFIKGNLAFERKAGNAKFN